MNFTIDRKALLDELHLFAGVVDSRGTDLTFASVTFRSVGDQCELSASGGEIGLRSTVPADSEGEGFLSVPVGRLAAWLKEVRGAEVLLEDDDDSRGVRGRCGKAVVRIPGRVGEPPKIETPPDEPVATVGASTMATLLAAGSYAFPDGPDAHPGSAGAQIEVRSGEIRVVSSDHSRLAFSSARVLGAESEEGDATQSFGISMKTVTELKLLCRAGDRSMKFFSAENHLFFDFGHRLLVCSRLSDRLPEYEHVIPKECPILGRVDRAALLAAVQSALHFAPGEWHRARLDIKDDALDIEADSVLGEANATVEFADARGGSLSLHVNLAHFRDFARNVSCESAEIGFTGPDRPFLLRPVDEDDTFTHFCVGMPISP